MACNSCEVVFQSHQSVVVSIQTAGTAASLWVRNQGRNIVLIGRIFLCYQTASGGWGVLYLRPPPGWVAWYHPSQFLEQGVSGLFYQFNVSPAFKILQAHAEYVELEGRSRSCALTFF